MKEIRRKAITVWHAICQSFGGNSFTEFLKFVLKFRA